MKREPCCAIAFARRRVVFEARARRLSIDTPSNLPARSARFAASILPRMPSAMARLDIAVEHLPRPARQQSVPREVRCILKRLRLAGGEKERRGIEDDDVLLRLGTFAVEQLAQAFGIFSRIAADR